MFKGIKIITKKQKLIHTCFKIRTYEELLLWEWPRHNLSCMRTKPTPLPASVLTNPLDKCVIKSYE